MNLAFHFMLLNTKQYVMPTEVVIMWLRRDLRLSDNAALYHALNSGLPVVPVFIFDTNILNALEDKKDKRVQFIYHALKAIQQQLEGLQSSLEVFYGTPEQMFLQLLEKYKITKVLTNHDYELYAIERDQKIAILLKAFGTEFVTFKDHVIFEKAEVVKDDGKPYTVFTPYSRKWKSCLQPKMFNAFPTEKYFNAFYKQPSQEMPSLEKMGFVGERNGNFQLPTIQTDIIEKYHLQRNFPAKTGTTHLGVHLRFGTISIRQLAKVAASLNEVFLNELIWRDFYQMILFHFPSICEGKPIKPAYDNIAWRNDEVEFSAWCNGMTGYPIVDAGMRELNATGFMHNRVRMVAASFLIKHLLIDWRWGEAYFAKKLLDFDFASNNGGWQWAAGSGCDAAPYFRIFNPTLQTNKFDPEHKYIIRWVPDWNQSTYPSPIVEHAKAYKRALEVYKQAIGGSNSD